MKIHQKITKNLIFTAHLEMSYFFASAVSPQPRTPLWYSLRIACWTSGLTVISLQRNDNCQFLNWKNEILMKFEFRGDSHLQRTPELS